MENFYPKTPMTSDVGGGLPVNLFVREANIGQH